MLGKALKAEATRRRGRRNSDTQDGNQGMATVIECVSLLMS